MSEPRVLKFSQCPLCDRWLGKKTVGPSCQNDSAVYKIATCDFAEWLRYAGHPDLAAVAELGAVVDYARFRRKKSAESERAALAKTTEDRERRLREAGYSELTENERASNAQVNMLEIEARQGR